MAFFRVIAVRVSHYCEECFESIKKGEKAVIYYQRPLSQQHGLIKSEDIYHHISCFKKRYSGTLDEKELTLLSK